MKFLRSLLYVALGLAASVSVNAHDAVPALPTSELDTHCACIDEANVRYDPYDAFDDPHLPTLAVEVDLRRWVYVENTYAMCMQHAGMRPRQDVFPYGVSDYPDGPEFHPRECRGWRSGYGRR